MPDLATDQDIATIPKVELHVHLNGSISEATAQRLAARHGETGNDLSRHLVDGRYPGTYAGFDPFLAALLAANRHVREPEDLELVAREFVRHQARQRVAYSEAILTPMILVRNGMDPAQMWRALRDGLASAAPETRVGLIVDTVRDLGAEEAAATIRLVEDADAPIVGLGLTGIEGTVPVQAFLPFRAAARRLGLGFEVHAGEMGPPSSIVESLDVLEADRIGHGVAAIRDAALMERLAREQVPLDVCPSSNVAIGLFGSLEEHPVAEFWRRGLALTISSDDPPFFRTTLIDELRHVVRMVGLTRDGLADLQRRSIQHAFADAGTKERVRAEIDRWAATG